MTTILPARVLQRRGEISLEDGSRARVYRQLVQVIEPAGVVEMPLPTDDEVPVARDDLPAWACPRCGVEGEAVVVTTERGFDWIWHPTCRGWHRRPVGGSAVEEALCPACELVLTPGQAADDPLCDRCSERVEARRADREAWVRGAVEREEVRRG